MENQDHSISVVGRAEWTAQPNVITAELGVAVTRARIQEAWSIVSARVGEVTAALLELGLQEVDIATRHLTAHVEQDYSNGAPELVGYRVEHLLGVTIRDVGNGPNLVEAAMVVGGDYAVLNGITFGHERPGELVDRARQRAWSDAQQRASQLASLAGVRLGAPLSIQEIDGGTGVPVGAGARRSDMAMMAAMPIPTGQISGAISLAVRFALQR